jgi:hypothetical protein
MPIAYDPNKPLERLRSIADSLGWRGLQMWRQTFPDRDPVHWYETTDSKFMLWINEYPLGQNEVFAATVHADRYGICSGLHRFSLSDPKSIASLAPWITRDLFRNPTWRRKLQQSHPECCLVEPTPSRCVRKRRRGEWPPYDDFAPKPAPPAGL